MSRTAPTEEIIYRFDDITVDGKNFRVVKNGAEITLTPRAFDVLIFLLRNSERVVEKKEIFESVWKDTFVSDNALTKIIKEIRQSIGDDAGNPLYIETVPRRGYRFIAEVGVNPQIDSGKKLSESLPNKITQEAIKTRSVFNWRYLPAIGIILLIAFIGVGFILKNRQINSDSPSAPPDSIAVMPFENAVQDENLQYLSDGITESIINDLSSLPNLRVVPRSTVFRYRNKSDDLYSVGRSLGAQTVLSGKLSSRGDMLTIQIELFDVRRNAQIWGSRYERKPADLAGLQNDISRDVSDKLLIKLSTADVQKLSAIETNNPDAYQLYLKGRFFWNKRTVKDLQRSIEFFQQSVSLDPNYALGYAGLADAYAMYSGYGGGSASELMPKARENALKALSLNYNLTEAHASLGTILHDYYYDLTGAAQEYKTAIELNPNYPTAHQWYGETLTELGRFDEGFAEFRRALELDPLSAKLHQGYATRLFLARRYDESLEKLNQTLELDAGFAPAYYSLYLVHFAKGNYAQSIEAYAKFNELVGEPQNAEIGRESFAKGGWQNFLKEMTGKNRPSNDSFYTQATYFAALGDKEKAFKELNASYAKRESVFPFIKIDPRLDNLRDDPRFNELLQRVGFPLY